MKHTFSKIVTIAALSCLAAIGTGASATILTFEELGPGTSAFFSAPYQGLTFGVVPQGPGGSWYWSREQLDNNGNPTPPLYKSPITSASTEQAIVNNQAVAVFKESEHVSSFSPFKLNGAWFTGLDNLIDVTFKLYSGTTLVHTSSTLVLGLYGDPAQFLATGYGGLIDSFTVEAFQGYFAMDDVTIPEPASYALVLAALSGLALSKRRSKR